MKNNNRKMIYIYIYIYKYISTYMNYMVMKNSNTRCY